ncbi:MAG: hypothetical protein AUI50_00900 [Crenarchaeota archaeon 13_1_40CM_2_52_14]|nr:MAG: hypothetical protein AUI50_00900 [Crenarchaeota archaeon 13_1_40CM_2_52_14]OLE68806.1 MAG: hypothetical protein AUF78_14215 [archaeon 13_1_20CM_2_51_12]
MNRIDLSTPSDVITLRGYETCPTIKSDNDLITVIVVKSDGNSHSIEAGSNHGDDNYYEPLESRSVGEARQ